MKACLTVPRCVLVSAGILGLVLASTIISLPVIAQEKAAGASSAQSSREGLPPLPLSPIEKADRDGTALRISLKELTKIALRENIDIAIQDTNEEQNQLQLIQAYAAYDPSLSANLSYNSRKSLNTSAFDMGIGGDNTSKSAQWSTSFSQPVKTGGTFSASWNNGRSDTNSNMSLFNPSYSSSMSFQFQQPLLRNRKIDSNRNQIKLTKLDMKTSDSSFKQSVTNVISNIHTNYWDLVLAIRNYEIARNSLTLGQINLRDNKKRLDVGTIAPINVIQAESQLASRELALEQAEERILSAENAIRKLVSSDRHSDIWKKVIVPTDLPDFQEYKVDEEFAIETALRNRPEMEQHRIALERQELQLNMLKNNRKWQVNLTGQFGSSGAAGPQSCQRNQFTGGCNLGPDDKPILTIKPSMVGGFGTVNKTLFTEGALNWQVSFNVNVPLRNRSIDAQIANQNITRRRELMNVRKDEQNIQAEIKDAIQTLESNRRQIEVAKVSVGLNEAQLDAEQKRYEAGLSENYRVLEQQNNLAQQEVSYLQALINYKRAIIALQRSMYTLLEANDFEIAKGSSKDK